jgi:hypothetical protein
MMTEIDNWQAHVEDKLQKLNERLKELEDKWRPAMSMSDGPKEKPTVD